MKILLIEDQFMVRSLLARVCREHPDCDGVLEATRGADGVRLCGTAKPAVVLLDLELPDCDGLDLIESLRAAAPATAIIIVTSHATEYAVHRSLELGVTGFVDKGTQAPNVLISAIDAVREGRLYFSPIVARVRARLRNDPRTFTKVLSQREQRILCLIGTGLSNEEIGKKLHLTPDTVQTHRRNILLRLGIHSTPQLMRYALEKGFARPPPSEIPET